MTSSNGNIFRVTGHTQSFDVFFDLRLNQHLSKHSWSWWFETSSCPLWRQSNVQSHSQMRQIENHVYNSWNVLLVRISSWFCIMSNHWNSAIVLNPISHFHYTLGTPITMMDQLSSQHEWVITCPVRHGVKLFIHSETFTFVPLKFGNG